MGLPTYVIRCERCDLRQRFDDFSCGSYELAEGVRWPIDSQPAWCSHCGLTHVERLPTLAELESRRITIEALPASWLDEVTGFEIRRTDRLRELEVVRGWLASRKSPPRCTQCGATDTTPCDGDLDEDTLIHAGCGGRIRTEEWSMVLPRGTRFTPEGVKIDQ